MNKSINVIGAALIIFGVGFWIGRGFRETPQVLQNQQSQLQQAAEADSKIDKSSPESTTHILELERKLELLTAENERLKTLHQENTQQTATESGSSSTEAPEPTDSSHTAKSNLQPTPSPAAGSVDWVKIDKRLTQLASEEEEKKLLEATVIQDLYMKLKENRPIANFRDSAITKIVGVFEGEVTYFKGRKKRDLLKIELIPGDNAKKFEGQIAIILTDPETGKAHSNSSGNGDLNQHVMGFEQSKSLILKLHRNDYIHLFYVTQLDSWIGNYYAEKKTGSYERTGTVKLSRG